MDKTLGKVEDIRFGLEGHGIMSISIGIDFGGVALDD